MLRKGILDWMGHAVAFMSGVTYVVLMALTLTLLRPTLLAAQLPPELRLQPAAEHHDPHEGHRHLPPPEDLRLARVLDELAGELAGLERKSGLEIAAAAPGLERFRAQIAELDRAVRSDFDRIGGLLAGADRSAEHRRRHQEARDAYRGEMDQLLAGLDVLHRAGEPAQKSATLQAVLGQLRSGPRGRPHQPLDPENLPFGRAETETRSPHLTAAELDRLLAGDAAPAAEKDAKAHGVTAPPQPADTAENADVQITPEIDALAASLGDDPLEIYRWVHDNVVFIPTYGSTQGSQMTLTSRSGNAFDVASLLIALLRAADVPARFVLGTVEIPAAQVQNWLGDVATPQLAQQVLGQGGIPNVGLIRGGEITHIRIEHVWVRAWVDYVPSRGARPVEGDTWVPMDASFKQYEFTEPVGLFETVPFDAEGLQDQVLATAVVDDALGLIAEMNEELMYEAAERYAEDAQEFFNDGGFGTGREALLGSRSVLPATDTVLAGSLPFEILAQGTAVATLPASLRLGVTLNGYASAFERALGNPSFAHTISLPELNSRRLGVTYEPATPADAQIIEDAIANGDTTLPLYLIDVKPVIKVDDQVVSTGAAVGMGSRQFLDVVVKDVGSSAVVPYEVLAGDEMVFGITANGVTQEVVQERYDTVASDNAAENLHQSALHFWMQSDFFNTLTAESLGIHVQRRPSVGLFSSPLTASFLFGAPRTGYYVSRFMDVKRSFLGAAGDPDLVRSFFQQSGKITSFLEGLVFDQLFSEDGFSAGFSAVDLIADANRQGIPTYFITAANVDAVLPLLAVSSAVKADVSNAVATGKTVLISGQEITRGDWTGVGYIVEDPDNGTAGYLISGGLAGGGRQACERQPNPLVRFILVVLLILLLILIIIAIIKSLGTLGPVLKPAFAAIIAFIAVLLGTSPAYASSGGGFRKGGQANPWKCPPPPPGDCRFDKVPPSRPHYPCPDDHWHYRVYNQDANCNNFLSSWQLGGCGPQPVPCPPC